MLYLNLFVSSILSASDTGYIFIGDQISSIVFTTVGAILHCGTKIAAL